MYALINLSSDSTLENREKFIKIRGGASRHRLIPVSSVGSPIGEPAHCRGRDRSWIHCGGLGSKAGQQRIRPVSIVIVGRAIRIDIAEIVVVVVIGGAEPPVSLQ